MPKLSTSSSHWFGPPPPPLWFLSELQAAKMKKKASGFLKQVLSRLVSIVKAKSAVLKSKTNAVKTRLIIFRLLHNKRLLVSSISDKIHELIGQGREDDAATSDIDHNKTMAQYYSHAAANEAPPECKEIVKPGGGEIIEDEEEEDSHPDLGIVDNMTGSEIELVKYSRGHDPIEFVLDEDIDRVAELFIKRFHERMRMQEMLESTGEK